MPTLAKNPLVTIDGNFSDWISSERIDYGDQPGYSLYATAQSGFLYFDLNAAAGVAIGPNTTIWLNTDLNAATGYQIFGSAGGAEYNVNIKPDGTAAVYSGADGQTLVLDNIPIAYSADKTQVEFAIPLASIGNPSNPLDVLYDVNNTTFGPISYANQPYVAPNADVTRTPTHRVAIVYSDTTAANYFRSLGDAAGAASTAYDDLFMAAQNQARMAGVSYDVIDESQLTNVNNLIGYDALIFPAMTNVNTAQLPAIMSALTSAVYDYHISLITSGDFLTNDQAGAPLAGNPYVNMETLLGLQRAGGGNSGNVSVTANDLTNPAMQSYTAGQVIQTYTGVGYTDYEPVGSTPKDVLVNQSVTDPTLAGGSETIPGVIETTVGGTTNVQFASQALLGDSNLLSNVIQSVVLGTQPGIALHTSRLAGIVAARMDMDQAQVPADVSPAAGGPGIYDELMPILSQWKTQYNFVGSYYVDIGDNPSATDPTTTNWTKSLPYYQQILALGSEIGSHSYTHLINPPTATFTAHVVGSLAAGATQITLDQVPSFYGITAGMWLSGTGIGSNTLASGAVVHTQVTAVSGNTITISYDPDGAGPTGNQGTIGALSDGQALTFSIPTENTNFLEPANGTDLSGANNPFTYQFEFGTSKTLLEQMLGITIYGAAVPGAGETAATSQNILQYFPSGTGYTGYVTGGWTGIESGYPSAFGYINPTQQGAVYIAPNVTFDFTEIQYQGKTVAQAEADWVAQFNAISANAAGTPIVVWPIHDYGAAAWNATTDSPTGSPYATQMYTDFIAQAYNAGYEFVTLEELASRIVAQEKAHIDYTTVGNAITATVTPDPTAPDLGVMALDVVNNGAQVIQNVTNWYAYNAQEVFLPKNGGSFTINLGATQDVVTHITSLPMRCDLVSCTGDGLHLKFSVVGDGQVVVDLGNFGSQTPVVTGATSYTLAGSVLNLSLVGLSQHDITIGGTLAAPTFVLAAASDSGPSSSDGYTNVTLPTFTGTYVAGDTVTLFDGATVIGTAVASATGQWSITATTKLADGVHQITAQASDAFGDVSPMSAAFAMTVDTVAATPTNLALAAGLESGGHNITGVPMPTFTGKGEVNGLITIYDGTTVLGTGSVAANGTWSVIDTVPLAKGVHSITAVEQDQAGNIGTASAGLSITIDTRPSVGGMAALPPDAILGAGATASLTVSMGQVVTVSGGKPTLTLNNGGIASYTSGSGTGILTFSYTVAPKQDVSQLSVTGINLNGATVTDSLGAAADFSHVAITPPGWLEIAPSAISAFDTSTQLSVPVVANHYRGPVAGLHGEYINISSDNLNVTASSPNWFIHTGSGMDAIAVNSGTNVLDGGTGSNFLVGGSGTDTFFVDDRGASADIWSTVVGFHQGDGATIWGVTPQDFNLAWVDGQGAAGYTGLTLHATAPSSPTASLTLTGYTHADLTNGRLTVQFGTDAASGSAYMYIHGNA